MQRIEADVLINNINDMVDDDARVVLRAADTNDIVPEWSDKISRQMPVLFYNWRFPGPKNFARPASPYDALASYGNRPETSDEDYARCRDFAPALATMLPQRMTYGESIPAALATFAANQAPVEG